VADATPVENLAAYTGVNCAAIAAWMSQPEGARTLEAPPWPEVLAEGVKSAGEIFNAQLMSTVAASLYDVSTTMSALPGDAVEQDAGCHGCQQS
jgi:hypothetical protein